MQALLAVVTQPDPKRAARAIEVIGSSITGGLLSKPREPAGCKEICPVLLAAMERADYTGYRYNDNEMRVQDLAAMAFGALRTGPGESGFPGNFFMGEAGTDLFNPLESDESKRDAQIDALKKWYRDNEARLTWDEAHHRLALKPASGSEQ